MQLATPVTTSDPPGLHGYIVRNLGANQTTTLLGLHSTSGSVYHPSNFNKSRQILQCCFHFVTITSDFSKVKTVFLPSPRKIQQHDICPSTGSLDWKSLLSSYHPQTQFRVSTSGGRSAAKGASNKSAKRSST